MVRINNNNSNNDNNNNYKNNNNNNNNDDDNNNKNDNNNFKLSIFIWGKNTLLKVEVLAAVDAIEIFNAI